MWTEQVRSMIGTGILETLYMTVVSTVFGYLFGLPMGILLCITDKEGLKPNKVVYKILDVIANIVRSIPFLILLILLIPFTRLLLGKSYGSTATIVPLTAAAIPFIARMVESSLKESITELSKQQRQWAQAIAESSSGYCLLRRELP